MVAARVPSWAISSSHDSALSPPARLSSPAVTLAYYFDGLADSTELALLIFTGVCNFVVLSCLVWTGYRNAVYSTLSGCAALLVWNHLRGGVGGPEAGANLNALSVPGSLRRRQKPSMTLVLDLVPLRSSFTL